MPAPHQLTFGYRSQSSHLAHYQPFCTFDHPNVIGGLQALQTDPAFLDRVLGTQIFSFADLVFLVDLESKKLDCLRDITLTPDMYCGLQALAGRLRTDVLWLAELLRRIPFQEIAEVLTPWIVNTTLFNPNDLLWPEEFDLDHGPSVIVSPHITKALPQRSSTEMARDRDADVQERVVFEIPGLPPAVLERLRRGKPRVRIPGVPATHALRDSPDANNLFCAALGEKIVSCITHML